MGIRVLIALIFIISKLNGIIIMIDPAGDSRNPGRSLDKGYERGITLQIAESLQREISDRYDAKCFLTRAPGEEVLDLQNASFSNRMGANLYLRIQTYREEQVKPKVYVYHLVYDPMVDLVPSVFSSLMFLPLHRAHIKNIGKTRTILDKMKAVLTTEEYKRKIDFHGPYGIPFKPLSGIVAPAVAIELGLRNEDNWGDMVGYIVESLRFLLSWE